MKGCKLFSRRTERIAIAVALVVVAVVSILLFGRSTPPPVVGVLLATEPWPRGGTGGSAVLDVPESLGPLLVTPDGIGDRVAAFDIPANTFLTAGMLRPPGADLADDGLARIRLAAGLELWPLPGPSGGDQAVIGPAGSSCALIVTELRDVDPEGASVTVSVDPPSAERLLAAGDLSVWPPAAGTWPECPPSVHAPILDTPPRTSRLRLTTNSERWPAPGPVPGDLAVVGPAAHACALVITQVLDSDVGGNVTIAATPENAVRLISAGDLAVWPPGSGVWPHCEPTIPPGAAPVRFLADTTYWPPPGPADGDLAVVGPPGAGCAWLVATLLRADGPSVTLAATPDVAARLMAEPVLAVWPPTTDGSWPHCDDASGETATPTPGVAAGSALACAGAGGTWNPDSRQCEGL